MSYERAPVTRDEGQALERAYREATDGRFRPDGSRADRPTRTEWLTAVANQGMREAWATREIQT